MIGRRLGAIVVATLLVAGCGGPGPTSRATVSPPAATPAPTGDVSAPTAAASSSPTPSATPTPSGEAVVVVTCDGTAASASTSAVRALADGIHLEAVTTDGSPVPVDVTTDESGWIATVEGAATLVVAPGPYGLVCAGDEEAGAEIAVVDPDGLWKSAEVTCVDGGGTSSGGGAPSAAPEEAIAFLRTIIAPRDGDILEPAGYPDAPSGWIRLVRDGEVVGSWFVTGRGTSMGLAATRHCAGAVDQAPVIPASIRWRVAEIPPMFGRRGATPRAVAAGKGTFVAVGDRTFQDTTGRPAGGRAGTWRSANGMTWRPSTFARGAAVGDDIPLSGPQAGLADVTSGADGFVAVGIVLDGGRVLGRAWRSRDGRAWTVVRLPGESRARPASVTWSGERYVAVGVVEATGAPRAAAWLSDDGRNWRRAADSSEFDIGGYVDTMEYRGWGGPRDVTADANEELRALGITCTAAPEEDGGQACRPMLWQSPDAEEWARLDPGEAVTGSSLSSLASIEGYLVAVGGSRDGGVDRAHVLVPDGTGGWRVVEPPGVPRLDRVVALDRGFLAASTAGGRISLWSSLDGAAWQDVPGVPQPADDVRVLGPIDLVVAGSRIVLVGSAETDSGKDPAFAVVGVLP